VQQSKKTVGTYSETEDLIAAIQGEFGSDYTIADWNDLVAIEDIDEWINCMELEDETERFMLTRDGEYFYNGNRQYMVCYYENGNVPGNWLVHDHIANKLYLGSWYDLDYHVLAKKGPTSVQEIKSDLFDIYPNPASSLLNIRYEGLKKIQISIINSNGQNVNSSILTQKSIDVSTFPTGIYLIKITDENGNILLSRKILKK
jgi:hypothetical protein